MKMVTTLVAILIGLSVHAKTLIISDVDDTLKVVRTGNPLDTIGNAFNEHWAYPGMSEKYWELLEQIKDSEIVYLTNAPEKYLSRTHLQFLKNNHFPNGTYLPRPDDVSTESFKFHQINRLIKLTSPDRLILIGDNIERDPIIYNLVYQLYHQKGIKIDTFIHKLSFGFFQ